MPLVTLEIPYGWFVLGLCALVAILLSPLVYYYRVKAIRKSHRAETVAWRAATLLKGFGSFELKISALTKPNLTLAFDKESIAFDGKTYQWKLPFSKIRTWRFFDQNDRYPDFSSSLPFEWNFEFAGSQSKYCFDTGFVNDAAAFELIKAASVRALGANDQCTLEGLLLEIARSERLLHAANSNNVNVT